MNEILPIFSIVVLIFSVMVHEISHGAMALYFGDETAKRLGRLTFNPIKHIDPVGSIILPGLLLLTGGFFVFGWAKPVPYNPLFLSNQRWGPALVAAAGPLSNIILAVVLAVIFRVGSLYGFVPMELEPLFGIVVIINLALAVLNSLPIPPLDGAEVLKAIVPSRSPIFEGLRNLEQLGMWAVPIGLIVFLFIG
ncbi:MAG: site-2 protease family protein, partial [Candidatus Paceibacteria bacterium]